MLLLPPLTDLGADVRDDPKGRHCALQFWISPLSKSPPAAVASDRIARIRPGAAAAVAGMVVGLTAGCAYLGGTVAQANSIKTQAGRLESVAAAGFTEEALAAAAGGMDDSALTIARRHDPYTVAGGAQRDRQSELMAARLEQLRQSGADRRDPNLRQVALGGAARPFRLGSALDQSRDLECLTQAVYYEARGEGRDGMQAVAQVVLNRARHGAFPRTVCGVVFQGAGRRTGCQFSFTCDGSMRGRVNRAAWERARKVAERALSGSVYAPVGNATFFHTTSVAPAWRSSMVRVNQVGSHVFYRFGGRNGSQSAFAYQPGPSSRASAATLQQADLNADRATANVPQGPVSYSALVGDDQPAPPAARPAQASAPVASPAQTQPQPQANLTPVRAPVRSATSAAGSSPEA